MAPLAFSFSLSEVARWLGRVAMRRACWAAWSNAATALASDASLDCTSTSNGRGSMRYRGSPALTSLPWLNMRSMTMPEMRGRTSETRVGATRPGSSRTIARACGRTVTTLTSGSLVWADTTAEFVFYDPGG